MTIQQAITPADISLFNGEPTISDKKLAALLGYTTVSNFRQLIRKHMPELSRHGPVLSTETQPEVFSCGAQENTRGRGRPSTDYRLNRKQALTICAKSETPNAAEILFVVVSVFDQWLAGTLPPAPVNSNLPERAPAPVDIIARNKDLVQEYRMSHSPAETRALWRKLGLPEGDSGNDPEALACLRHLLDAEWQGKSVRTYINDMFQAKRNTFNVHHTLKIDVAATGFLLPIVNEEIAKIYEGTRWARPFEQWLKLEGARDSNPRGGKVRYYVWIPSHYLDE